MLELISELLCCYILFADDADIRNNNINNSEYRYESLNEIKDNKEIKRN